MSMQNFVQLTGKVMEGTVRSYQDSRGNYATVFKVRTMERWYGRDGGGREHYEYHNVIVRDFGGRRLAALCASKLAGGERVLVVGALRTRLRRSRSDSQEFTETLVEIEAQQIERLLPLEEAVPLTAVTVDEEVQSAPAVSHEAMPYGGMSGELYAAQGQGFKEGARVSGETV